MLIVVPMLSQVNPVESRKIRKVRRRKKKNKNHQKLHKNFLKELWPSSKILKKLIKNKRKRRLLKRKEPFRKKNKPK